MPLQSGVLRITKTPQEPREDSDNSITLFANPLTRMARTRDGHDVAIRVITINNEGHDHLSILRKVATGPITLLSNNHVLPMFTEFHFHDVAFGIFPKVGWMVSDAYDYWAKNSVGDIVDMLMQALEGLAFIHDLKVAHRDAFRDNFLIQWHPESMRSMTIPVSRPRVYLIDFEVAVEFPPDCPPAECVCTGYPLGGSFSEPEMYSRPPAPEMTTSEPYSPFKTDVWQLGISFADFHANIPGIDEVLKEMTHADPGARPCAGEALEKLARVVNALPPAALLIHPEILLQDP
ncbi:hypothetical protein BYT27DRAFT_6845910 [Phlegmacium glaucopus]|nr:hypothetical protein BYT27DRAFT_6845910 [Phlegmacium glaucopus]